MHILKILFVQSDMDSKLCLWCGLSSGVSSFRRGIFYGLYSQQTRSSCKRKYENIQRDKNRINLLGTHKWVQVHSEVTCKSVTKLRSFDGRKRHAANVLSKASIWISRAAAAASLLQTLVVRRIVSAFISKHLRTASTLNFRRRIKSRLPFVGIIRSSPYSTRFMDKV